MSIKGQLTSLIIATVVLASFFAALHGFRSSMQQLDSVFDQELASVAEIIASVAISSNELPTEIEGELAFQVFANQRLISKSQNAPSQAFYSESKGFNETTFFSKRWRTYTLTKQEFTIVVAQAIESRIQSAEAVLFVTITPIVIAIPIIAFLVFYIIRKSLYSLIRLSRELSSKSSDDLTQITIQNPPEELQPVITRLNHLLARVELSFEREKQLTANAAHELRTPISVLTLSAHNLAEDFALGQMNQEAIEELKINVARMAYVIEQMIALFRFTPEQFRANKQSLNLQSILQEVISNNFEDIDKQAQSISLESLDVWVQGEQFALYTLFENILRNAIKYSGEKSEIQLILNKDTNYAYVQINDSGKGVSDTEYDKIFERFYRVIQSPSEQKLHHKGVGLGLSIVKHIVHLHDGNISAEKSSLGGLSVQVKLPLTKHGDIHNA